MQIIETFPAPDTKAGRLFWLPAYVRLSQEVHKGFLNTGETYEAKRFAGNCSSRWGVTRACADAILNGSATFTIDNDLITVTRTVPEE